MINSHKGGAALDKAAVAEIDEALDGVHAKLRDSGVEHEVRQLVRGTTRPRTSSPSPRRSTPTSSSSGCAAAPGRQADHGQQRAADPARRELPGARGQGALATSAPSGPSRSASASSRAQRDVPSGPVGARERGPSPSPAPCRCASTPVVMRCWPATPSPSSSGMLLDQQMPMERAFLGPWKLAERLGHPRPGSTRAASRRTTPRIRRALAATLRGAPVPRLDGRPHPGLAPPVVERVRGRHRGDLAPRADRRRRSYQRLSTCRATATQKSRILVALLGKQFGVRPAAGARRRGLRRRRRRPVRSPTWSTPPASPRCAGSSRRAKAAAASARRPDRPVGRGSRIGGRDVVPGTLGPPSASTPPRPRRGNADGVSQCSADAPCAPPHLARPGDTGVCADRSTRGSFVPSKPTKATPKTAPQGPPAKTPAKAARRSRPPRPPGEDRRPSARQGRPDEKTARPSDARDQGAPRRRWRRPRRPGQEGCCREGRRQGRPRRRPRPEGRPGQGSPRRPRPRRPARATAVAVATSWSTRRRVEPELARGRRPRGRRRRRPRRGRRARGRARGRARRRPRRGRRRARQGGRARGEVEAEEESEAFVISDVDDTDEPVQTVTVAGATADPVKDYLKQIGKVPLLNAEQEVELAKRIEAGLFAEEKLQRREDERQTRGDLEWIAEDGRRAKNHLLEANLRLVVSLAKRYTGRGMLSWT